MGYDKQGKSESYSDSAITVADTIKRKMTWDNTNCSYESLTNKLSTIVILVTAVAHTPSDRYFPQHCL